MRSANYSESDIVSAAFKDKPSHVRITFKGNKILTDDNIDSSGLHFDIYMNSETNLTIGQSAMAELTIPVIKASIEGMDIKWNDPFEFEIGFNTMGSVVSWVTVGKFIGTRPEISVSNEIITFTAHDYMQLFEKSADDFLDAYDNSGNNDTINLFLMRLCSEVGVYARYEQNPGSGDPYYFPDGLQPNLWRIVPKNAFNRGLTFRQVLETIAEAVGCYAVMDQNGYLDLRWFKTAYIPLYDPDEDDPQYTLAPQNVFPPVNKLESFKGVTWAELESKKWRELESSQWADFLPLEELFKINAIHITNGEDDVGTYYPGKTNGNTYRINGNPLLTVTSQADINNYIAPIFNRLNSLVSYVPINFSCVGNPLIEVGDIVAIEIGNDTVQVPIFNIQSTWNGALTDYYEITGDYTLDRDASGGTGNSAIISSYGKTHKFIIDSLDEFISEITNSTNGNHTLIDQDEENVEIQASGQFTLNTPFFKIVDNMIQMWLLNVGGDKGALWSENTDINHSWGIGSRVEGFDTTRASAIRFEYSPYEPNGLPWITLENKHPDAIGQLIYGFTNTGTEDNPIWEPVLYPIGGLHFGEPLHPITEALFGDVWADHYYNNSSREVKHDIKPVEPMGDKIDKLRPVAFIYNNDKKGRVRYGLIYEETVDVMPNICTGDDEHKAIDYSALVPVLLKEIQDLRKRVADLERR